MTARRELVGREGGVRLLNRIAAQRVLPVLRADDVDDTVATARACARAGMKVVELTDTTPEVGQAVGALRGDGLVVGIGTLATAAQVVAACEAGANFVVPLSTSEGLVSAARAVGSRRSR